MITFNKSGRIVFLLVVACMIFLFTDTEDALAATYSPKAVTSRTTDTVTKGKLVKKKKGIVYQLPGGKLLKGTWARIKGNVYCFKSSGYAETGEFKYKGKEYFADDDGIVYVDRFRKETGILYYYQPDGSKLTGGDWMMIRGGYYFGKRGTNGNLMTDTWVSNRYLGEDGKNVTDAIVDGRVIGPTGDLQSPAETDRYVIIGASRIQDMSRVVNGRNTLFICKAGQKYSWFAGDGVKQLRNLLDQKPDLKVIFALGGNDMENINRYIRLFRKLMAEYPQTMFFYAGTTSGVDKTKNARRKQFNKKLEQEFGNLYFDTYEYLDRYIQTHVRCRIGDNHYQDHTSLALYERIIDQVKKRS